MKEKKTCHLCNEEFYPSHTNYHYKKQHPDFDFIDYKKEQQKLKLKNHKCKYCGCSIKNGECCSSDNCKEQKKKEKEKGNAIKNKKRKCHLCGEEISNYNPLLHYKEKHPDFDYESYKEERKQSKKKNYKCRYCGCSIKSGVCCLKKSCAKRKLNDDNIIKNNIKFDGKIENYDFISCPICGYKSTQLTNHYKNVHNLSYEEYHNLYPNLICCQKYRETNSERFSKEKNPAYQHGGRLSSNSIKFDKYINGEADYTIEDVRAKKRQTLKENPQRRKTRFEYWIERGYSQEEAREKVRERQTTFSKEKCIEKYGEEEGIKRWNDRQEKWLRTMDSKTQEEKDRINKSKVLSGNHVSKNEQEVYNYLKNIFKDIESQFILRNEDGCRIFDMKIGKKLVEYNGDYYHCNPKIYSSNFINKRLNKTSREVWEKDKKKIQLANKFGYELFTIWEKDYKENKTKILQECINFLNQ